jgi:hypothetical protein
MVEQRFCFLAHTARVHVRLHCSTFCQPYLDRLHGVRWECGWVVDTPRRNRLTCGTPLAVSTCDTRSPHASDPRKPGRCHDTPPREVQYERTGACASLILRDLSLASARRAAGIEPVRDHGITRRREVLRFFCSLDLFCINFAHGCWMGPSTCHAFGPSRACVCACARHTARGSAPMPGHEQEGRPLDEASPPLTAPQHEILALRL